MGPLAGIAGALHLARDEDYTAVLTCGVDSVGLPENLLGLLGEAPAYLADQPVIGLWPASAIATAETMLTGEGRHSMYAFAEAIGARAITLDRGPANINTPADLAAVRKGGAA
jgi:molybdopterin-guanine dinucleotide biosynthesis protein A